MVFGWVCQNAAPGWCLLSTIALLLTAVDDADTALLNKSMPVGPVAGGVMGCFLLLALAVYCYRCYSRRRSRHCDGSLPGEAHLRDSTVDFEDLDANDGNLWHIHSTLSVHHLATVDIRCVLYPWTGVRSWLTCIEAPPTLPYLAIHRCICRQLGQP